MKQEKRRKRDKRGSNEEEATAREEPKNAEKRKRSQWNTCKAQIKHISVQHTRSVFVCKPAWNSTGTAPQPIFPIFRKSLPHVTHTHTGNQAYARCTSSSMLILKIHSDYVVLAGRCCPDSPQCIRCVREALKK